MADAGLMSKVDSICWWVGWRVWEERELQELKTWATGRTRGHYGKCMLVKGGYQGYCSGYVKSKMSVGHSNEDTEWVVGSKSLQFKGEFSLFTGESGKMRGKFGAWKVKEDKVYFKPSLASRPLYFLLLLPPPPPRLPGSCSSSSQSSERPLWPCHLSTLHFHPGLLCLSFIALTNTWNKLCLFSNL